MVISTKSGRRERKKGVVRIWGVKLTTASLERLQCGLTFGNLHREKPKKKKNSQGRCANFGWKEGCLLLQGGQGWTWTHSTALRASACEIKREVLTIIIYLFKKISLSFQNLLKNLISLKHLKFFSCKTRSHDEQIWFRVHKKNRLHCQHRCNRALRGAGTLSFASPGGLSKHTIRVIIQSHVWL